MTTGATLILCLVAVVGGDTTTAAVDFDTDIIPILTKAGCNAGACHGAAIGRGGMHLSLYGGDPSGDYETIVHHLEGRRVNLAEADASLIYRKPTEALEHGGGFRLDPDEADAQMLLHWLEQGAPRPQLRKLVDLQILTQRSIVDQLPARVGVSVVARFDDGTERDVTNLTVIAPDDNQSVVWLEDESQLEIRRRGWHVIVARYLDRVVPIEVIAPLHPETPDLSAAARQNYVDDQVLAKLQSLQLPVSPAADDATFLRRLYLDLTGRLPTESQTLEFLSDQAADKRHRLIDELLASEPFVEFWTYRLATILRIHPPGRGAGRDTVGVETYHAWLKDQVAGDVPLDRVARELLTATGDSHLIGPANFYRTAEDARTQAELFSEVLMGVRLRCANCHNHPLDRWTQDDYHGLAAIFARVNQDQIVTLAASGEVIHPRTGEPAMARIPGERFLDLAAGEDPRQLLADWLTDDGNPYLARSVVNRVWKALMGRGLVEPADDLRATNQPTHPQLLDRLAEDFQNHEYRLRHIVRVIVTSGTYARSSVSVAGNEIDDRFYSRALVRPLEAEVLSDAIGDVTGVWPKYGKFDVGTRAITLADSTVASDQLDVLGRCSREDGCEAGGATGSQLTQKLHLMNGPLLNQKIADSDGWLQRHLGRQPPEQLVHQMYLRCLARVPDEDEQAYWRRQLEAAPTEDHAAVLEDLLWSLLTCREFTTNH